MLSTRYRFLFVHIPKTAGNSVQNVLKQYADDAIVCLAPHQDGIERFEIRSETYATHKHSTLQEYRREYGPELFERLYRFTCVRNPWDRAVSFYFSPHRGTVSWDRAAFIAFLDEIQPVRRYLSLEGQEPDLATAAQNVDAIMRYETLAADFRKVCADIGIPAQELPVRNKAPREHYARYYDPETAELVARRFADEIAFFGYSF